MPEKLCPVCRNQGFLLEETSRDALVNYYSCSVCRHIWTLNKSDPNAPPRNVTIPPGRRDPDESS
jgi:hypothetical protein